MRLLIFVLGLVMLCPHALASPKKGGGPGHLTGLASWYGKKEQGHMMANGQLFDRAKFTAASRTLAFGTLIRVENLATGLKTVVEITDRGPWGRTKKGHLTSFERILDLAEAPAMAIVCKGVCRVRITLLPPIATNTIE